MLKSFIDKASAILADRAEHARLIAVGMLLVALKAVV